MADSDNCSTCPFFHTIERQCRYDKPVVFPVSRGPGEMSFVGTWPPVRPEAWCGRHPGRALERRSGDGIAKVTAPALPRWVAGDQDGAIEP